jgi:hypothetical protein
MKQRAAIDQEHVRRLEKAFGLLVRLYRAGAWIEPGRGKPRIRPDRLAGRFDAEVKENGHALQQILTGQRKSWANGFDELALGLEIVDDEIKTIAGVRILDRRVLDRAFFIDLSEHGARDTLLKRLQGRTGLILASPGWVQRAAVGSLLAELVLGSKGLLITETPRAQAADYRDFLAGSAWMDMNVTGEGDPVAAALLLSMQVRSMRRDALREFKQGYYTASAVRFLARKGFSRETIETRLNLRREVLERWISPDDAPRDGGTQEAPTVPESSSGTASAPETRMPRTAARPSNGAAARGSGGRRKPTDKQVAYIRDIIELMPFLKERLPEDWEENAESAKGFLGMAHPIYSEFRNELRAFKNDLKVRALIAEGLSAQEIEVATGAGLNEVQRILSQNLAKEASRIAAAIGDKLGQPVRLS